MFLHLSKPLFQSRNPAVILGMANAYYHLAPSSGIIGQQLLVMPLLHLAGSSHVSSRGEEISALTWEVVVSMVEERKVSISRLDPRDGSDQGAVAFRIQSNSILPARL
jgi:AP-3 complex subunit beta